MVGRVVCARRGLVVVSVVCARGALGTASAYLVGFVEGLVTSSPTGIWIEEVDGLLGPLLFADEGDVGAFGGADEFVCQQCHVLVFELALVVLVVGAFVLGEGAGFFGCDGLAGDGVEDGAALEVGVGAGDDGDGDEGARARSNLRFEI